jgi:hypothetical protein
MAMRNSPRQIRRPGRLRTGSVVSLAASALVLASADAARGGPCTEDITLLERQIAAAVPGPESGPTGTQTVGAQLHHQPTPGSVERAEHVANKDADEALARAKQADNAGNAADCNAALKQARELYGIF